MHAGEPVAGDVEPTRCWTGRQHGGGERNALTAVEFDLAGADIEGGDLAAAQQLDLVGVVVTGVVDASRLGVGFSTEHGLRQRRPFVGHLRFVSDQDDAPVESG